MSATSFSQRDPRWAGEPLGTSDYTIGQAGCLLCGVASVMADCGLRTTPPELNRRLVQLGGYMHGCRLVFTALWPLGVELAGWLPCPDTPAPMTSIRAALAKGLGVLVSVDADRRKNGLQPHWVRVLAARTDCLIMDPWRLPGQEQTALLRWYAEPGWDSARTILSVVTLAPKGAVRGLSATHRLRLRGGSVFGQSAPMPVPYRENEGAG